MIGTMFLGMYGWWDHLPQKEHHNIVKNAINAKINHPQGITNK
jgi:hypothetical protein